MAAVVGPAVGVEEAAAAGKTAGADEVAVAVAAAGASGSVGQRRESSGCRDMLSGNF